LFETDAWLAALSASGDPLDRLKNPVDVELFRSTVNRAGSRVHTWRKASILASAACAEF
jgi:hypothetical protein